jgi:hypothetical protein
VKSHALASFWRCYDELPEHVQRLARKNFELFKANPRHPSLGFQKKGGVYTVEVGRSYRAIARERNGDRKRWRSSGRAFWKFPTRISRGFPQLQRLAWINYKFNFTAVTIR